MANKLGKFMIFATIAGAFAAGVSYMKQYHDFHKDLDKDFRDFEDSDLNEAPSDSTMNRKYVSLSSDKDEFIVAAKDTVVAAKGMAGAAKEMLKDVGHIISDNAKDASDIAEDVAKESADKLKNKVQDTFEDVADTATDIAIEAADKVEAIKSSTKIEEEDF